MESISTTFTQIKEISGTGWTIGGMTASQCGIPLVTPSHGNSMSGMDAFLPDAICLGDLLCKEGYELHYFHNSSIDFAGTGKFYCTHGFQEASGKVKLSKMMHDISY